MNLINLPSAPLLQASVASTASALPPDQALLQGTDAEALFSALLAGQLQALVPLAPEDAGQIAGDIADSSEDSSGNLVAELVAMLQDPQAAPDASVQAVATAPFASAIPLPAGLNGAADNSDPRQGLAVVPAAIAATDTDAAVAQAILPGLDLKAGVALTASLPVTEAKAASLPVTEAKAVSLPVTEAKAVSLPVTKAETVSPSQGAMAFSPPHLQQTQLNTPPQSLATPQPQTSIPQFVGSQAWGGMVGDRVVWMFGQQHQSAEIMLNPPALGPLEVRLSMSDGQASLTFTTQHAPVREALDAATPRLREMLSESGITLGDVSVNVGNFSRQDPQNAPRPLSAWKEPDVIQDLTLVTTDLPDRKGSGLLDLFA